MGELLVIGVVAIELGATEDDPDAEGKVPGMR